LSKFSSQKIIFLKLNHSLHCFFIIYVCSWCIMYQTKLLHLIAPESMLSALMYMMSVCHAYFF